MRATGVPERIDAIADALDRSGRAWFWLDGAAPAAGEARVSYLGIADEVRVATPGDEAAFLAGLRRRAPASEGVPDPGRARFRSGWVVMLGYEFGVGLMTGETVAPSLAREPSGYALRSSALLTIDHDAGRATLSGDPDRLRDLEAAVAPRQRRQDAEPAPSAPPAVHGGAPPVWRQNDADYRAAVRRAQASIRDGDAYVLCLTDTASVAGAHAPARLYADLRGGAVRGGVIVTPERALVSVSPERFLSVRGRDVATHPIKGTRPRGATTNEDARLALALANDPKERAENLMIVDLLRNDLTRVCDPASVRVDRFLRVESHPRVHQLVSTVSGTLSPDQTFADLLAATFPGGSMTGAPKRRAVELLHDLEAGPRGLYAGCFGWLDDRGDAELAMTIRSIELRGAGSSPGRFTTGLVGAGGGITVDSDPARESAEKHLKAAPLLAALTASL